MSAEAGLFAAWMAIIIAEMITTRPGGGPSDQESATAEAERTAVPRLVESGTSTPVESGKEQSQ